MPRRRKSLVPPEKQIPVAIGLGAFLILLVIWLYVPWPGGQAAAPPGMPIEELGPVVSIDELRRLTADIRSNLGNPSARPDVVPEVTRSPFHWEETVEPAGPERTARVETPIVEEKTPPPFVLSGTCLFGNKAFAMLDGRRVEVGDVVAGRIVKQIGEREVILQNGPIIDTIRMPEAPKI